MINVFLVEKDLLLRKGYLADVGCPDVERQEENLVLPVAWLAATGETQDIAKNDAGLAVGENLAP